MDDRRLDDLARSVGDGSRRHALRLVAGAVFAAPAALLGPGAVAAGRTRRRLCRRVPGARCNNRTGRCENGPRRAGERCDPEAPGTCLSAFCDCPPAESAARVCACARRCDPAAPDRRVSGVCACRREASGQRVCACDRRAA